MAAAHCIGSSGQSTARKVSRTAAQAGASANSPPDRYIPTPEEIAAACAEIQREWSPAELRLRSGFSVHALGIRTPGHTLKSQKHLVRWTVPQVRGPREGGHS